MMKTPSFTSKNEDQNTVTSVVYVDYENIYETLRLYRKDPFEMGFFQTIQQKLASAGLNVIDFIVYSNFAKKTLTLEHQALLRSIGLQTRPASNNGKSSGDLELTVDALRVLYKNPEVNVFIIISSDRDIIPLLKAIKYENKVSYMISVKTGFNQTVAEYADFHEYIEDIFDLTMPEPEQELNEAWNTPGTPNFNQEQIARAREVAEYFYHSNIWKRCVQNKEPINLNGYIQVITRVLNRSSNEILDDFKVAHHLKYVSIYHDQFRQQLYIKEGERMGEVSLQPRS
ncbi:MAG: NYN domain-containing protein [Firmicutes bacterium]|nr:NYN domain-containing protein [Bacillota bacterium]